MAPEVDAEGLVDQLRDVVRHLRQRIAALEADVQDLQQALQGSERQAAQLANLYVAIYQLHSSLGLDDVCTAMCEIAINLLGAERYALLLRDEERNVYEVIRKSAKVDAAFGARDYTGGDTLVDAALSYGVVRLGPVGGSSALAVVPLVVEGQTLGALVILGLLPHKAGFGVEDRELLDVLAAHAASAVLGARLFHERTRKLRTLESLMGLLRPENGR